MPREKLVAGDAIEIGFDLPHQPRSEAAPLKTRMHDETPDAACAILQNAPHRPDNLISELRHEYSMCPIFGEEVFQALDERWNRIVVIYLGFTLVAKKLELENSLGVPKVGGGYNEFHTERV